MSKPTDSLDISTPPSPSRQEEIPMGFAEGLEKFISSNGVSPHTQDKPVEVTQDPPQGQTKPNVPAPVVPDDDEEDEFPEIGKVKDPEVKPEAAPETKPDDFDEAAFDKETEEEIKGMEAKAGDKWKALKAQVKEAKKELAQAKATTPAVAIPDDVKQELETLRLKAQEAEELRERNNQLLQVNDEVAVKQSDAYIQGVTNPIREMDAIVSQIAEYSKVDIKTLADVIAESDVTKQDEMLEDLELKLGRRVASRIERLADDFKAIKAKERELSANAATTIAEGRKMKEREEARKVEEGKNRYRLSAEESFKAYASKIPGLTDSSGNLTDTAKAILDKTKGIDPSSLTPVDIGFMAFCTNTYSEARRAIVSLQKENAMLKASQGKGGSLPSTTAKASNSASSEEKEPAGLAEHMASQDLVFTGR